MTELSIINLVFKGFRKASYALKILIILFNVIISSHEEIIQRGPRDAA